MDRFGATDAWLMFLLWAAANGHIGAALVALVILTLYCFAFGSKPTQEPEGAAGKEDGRHE